MTPSRARTAGRRRARASVLSALAALAFGIVAASLLGEGLVRIAAWWSPGVRALAVPRRPRPPAFASLAEYLASLTTQVIPHRNWFNYWNNALGFNDEEFVVPKPAGRFRIMALGDSFGYGLVPYPDAVMTVLEARLRHGCPGKDVEVLNFGIGGIGVEDYRTITALAFTEYAPDLVVVHFYGGNDGPDAYALAREFARERWRWGTLVTHSRLWTLTANVVRIRGGVEEGFRATAGKPAGPAPGATPARGGTVVDPGYVLREDDPALTGPTFDTRSFDGMRAQELRRLYAPPDPAVLDRAWQPVFDDLDAIRERAAAGGARFALVFFPSEVGVHPGLPARLVEHFHRQGRLQRLSLEAVDPALPQKRLAGYCARTGVSCVDVTPALVRASQADPGARLYKVRDTHWTVRGNRVAAEAEAEQLLGLVCPRP